MTNIPLAAWAIDLWEKIVEAPRGLRLSFSTKLEATASRFALYTARNSNRLQSKDIFPPSDPAFGTSPWDAFRLTISLDQKTNLWVLSISRHSDAQFTPLHVEEI